MGRLLALTFAYLAYLLANAIASQRQQHRVQHGPCSYTFILPEVEHCQPVKDFQVTNTLQSDSPPEAKPSPSKQSRAQEDRPSWQQRKLETLESAMENNTQWLQKLENFIQENVRSGMEEIKRSSVHTQTAAMLEMGTNLLSQSAEQTRKLTDVETQVLNQTSRLEIQLLEYSLFTNRLEKHILLQTQEISRLSDKNSFLEQRLLALEARYGKELQGLQNEKQQLQDLMERQSRLVSQLQGELGSSTLNSTSLQRQQAVLTDTVQQLLTKVHQCNEISNEPKNDPLTFRDCAEILRSGVKENGVYTIRLHNTTQDVKVFCDMKTKGGGWTVLQHRRNGSIDFHRGWSDYKMGFGEPSGEHWLGNDIIYKLTSSQEYSLHIQLKDREGNEAFSLYDRFYIDGEDNNYSLHVEGFSGTAGKTSSLTHTGSQFSTKDRDNDRCTCKCSQLASGGWWFEACGPSNLNGIYYPASSNVIRYNGIKWYYWKGPNLMATMTTMMVRPTHF
ncbi:angiopoietin-2b [Austrofundulus limnaeus]|uniref:Angiopoietin-2b n=1 Tax=Austrofundulus limnaeus TaxID=52670 RepID=A0A2I4C5B6_AUSLI|nr:PREDICTED: angiopoietin-2-like [Austrofundulus limnaeus]